MTPLRRIADWSAASLRRPLLATLLLVTVGAALPILGLVLLADADVADGVWNRAVLLAVLGLALTLAGMLSFGLVIRHSVLRPVAALTEATRAFRDGAPDISLHLTGQDEIAELGRSFATMADDLGVTLTRLHRSEDRLQAILDAIPDAIRVVDADYRIVKANAAYAAQVGQPLDQVLGQRCYRSSHRRETPCPPTMVCCPLVEIHNASGPLTCRQSHFAADGQEMHVEVAAALVDLGTPTAAKPCIVEAIRDLDRQAKLSQEHRLAELGLLAAGLAHEIFNPLSSISLVAGAIEQDAELGDMQRLGSHLSTLRGEVERTLTLTNSLLTLCQPPGERQFIDLSQVIPQTLELLGFKLREAQVTLTTDIRPGVWIIASESDLRMSLSNIVLNGMHAMPGGGPLTVNARRVGDEVQIEVIDAGHGIAPEDLRRILLPFWTRRADGSRGSGLGLPLVQGAMERASGRLDVESIPGVGSRFTLVFPAPEVLS